jgi:hypothetical protein
MEREQKSDSDPDFLHLIEADADQPPVYVTVCTGKNTFARIRIDLLGEYGYDESHIVESKEPPRPREDDAGQS